MDAYEGRLPLTLQVTIGVYHDSLERGKVGGIPNGTPSRGILCWLLLGTYGAPVC